MRRPGSEDPHRRERKLPLLLVLLLVTLPAFTPEGIVIGFKIFAWVPK